jgi:RNA polymerase sigma-70 factor, ECF subfamily
MAITWGGRAVDHAPGRGYTGRHVRDFTARIASVTSPPADPSMLSDEQLAEALRRQDVEVLETLYQRHSRALFSLAFKMLGDQDAAEEVVQEAFLKLWQRPESYQPGRGRLVSWLLGVVHHRAVDFLRRRRLELRYSTDYRLVEPSGSPPDPEDELLATLRGEAVIRALRDLPSAQRLVVELAYVRGMTQLEISQTLGEPLGTVKTRLRLAMQKLRTSLELAEIKPGPS